MNTTEQALLIILSAFLAIFLLLGIIALVFIIKLVNKVRGIAENASHVTENIEAATESFRSAAGPMAFAKVFGTLYGAAKGAKKWKGK